MVFLEGERVSLRPVELSDLEGPYREWINRQESDQYTEHAQFPKSSGDLRDYWDSRRRSGANLWLAIEHRASGRHVGNIELYDIDWVHRTARFAILVGDPEMQGQGVGLEAGRLLLAHAFGKLNLYRIELGVHEENVGARRLYERIGFREEGIRRQAFLRDGRRSDLVVMGLLAREFDHG